MMTNTEALVAVNEGNQTFSDEDIAIISKRLIEKNFKAYTELAK